MPSPKLSAALIDDDRLVHFAFQQKLSHRLASLETLNHIPEDLATLPRCEVYFVDLHFPETSHLSPPERQFPASPKGLPLIKQLRALHPKSQIYCISGSPSTEEMKASVQAGANRFLPKPVNFEIIEQDLRVLEAEIFFSNAQVWVGSGETSQNVLRQVAEASALTGSVLISGETGTGKELVAQMLHQQRSRIFNQSHRPFGVINTPTLPSELFESELFGHVKGAFSGATQNYAGLLKLSQKGDVLFDEIQSLPLDLQPKLLRYLQSKEIKPVGGDKTERIEAALIFASNEDLKESVKKGQFREDLYQRINSFEITLPPLRERKSEIEGLAIHFLSSNPLSLARTFEADALERLKAHPWPGNVRELKKVCDRLSRLCPLPMVRQEDVERCLDPAPSAPHSAENLSLQDQVLDFEKSVISKTLLDLDWRFPEVCAQLKVSRASLYKKIKDFGIQKKRGGS